MRFPELWNRLTPASKVALVEKIGTSYAYMSQLAHGHRNPSPALCRRLVAADRRLTLKALRPDIWGTAPPPPVRPRVASKRKSS